MTKNIDIWLARDRGGILSAFTEKPLKFEQEGIWNTEYGKYIDLPKKLWDKLPELKWEDEEPLKCTLTIEI